MASPARSVHAIWTARLIELAVERGVSRDALADAAGFDDATPRGRIPEARHLAVWECVMNELRDPGFPIAYARRMRVDEYAVLGFACKTAPTLRDACRRLVRFLPLWNATLVCELREHARGATLILQGPPGGLGQRCVNEAAIAQVVAAVRQICADDVRPERAHFRHAAPADTTAHRDWFGGEVVFASDIEGIELSAAAVDAPVVLADEGLSRFLVGQLEAIEAARSAAPSRIAPRVARAIGDALPNGVPGIDDIARRVAMSRRTLQRRLADEGTRFADLVRHTRLTLAQRLLASTPLSIAEVAALLGFSEPSAFHRAFKRWTGATPASVRAGADGQ